MSGVLSNDCKNAIIALQESLKTKEYKLAGYVRHAIKDCMDACTTSPVESNNNTVKHGPSFVNARMNLDNSICKLTNGVNLRLNRRRHAAEREMNKTNKASCAPTKDYTTKRGQALIDRNHDNRVKVRWAQVGPEEWIAWQFERIDNLLVTDDMASALEMIHTHDMFLHSTHRTSNMFLYMTQIFRTSISQNSSE